MACPADVTFEWSLALLAWQPLDVGAGFAKGELTHNPVPLLSLEERMETKV